MEESEGSKKGKNVRDKTVYDERDELYGKERTVYERRRSSERRLE